MDAGVLLVLGGIAVVVGLVLYFGHVYEQSRSRMLAELASEMGLEFSQQQPASWLASRSLPLFTRGYGTRYWNVLRGESEEETVFVFDYRYSVGSGKHKRTYKQTVVAFQSPQLNLPRFEMAPESFLHRLGELFGRQDIDFDDHPQFSRRYQLRGDDEQQVRQLFAPPLREYLEGTTQLCLQGERATLIVFRHGRRVPAGELKEVLREAYHIYAFFKGGAAADSESAESVEHSR